MTDIQFDYFTAAETEQYTFYRIPKALFTEIHFQALSCEAKVLYGMMLDRLGLSIRNQWFDSQGRAYIIFTVEDVMGVMRCQSQKAVRLMKELDTADGIGLIEKKRIGLGRPNRIYVKNFMVRGNGGSENGTGGTGRIQQHTADIMHSPGIFRKKTAEPEIKADAGHTVGNAAAVMPETQDEHDQNWWMCGESIPENEKHGKTDAGMHREENSPHDEDWWDMEADAPSGTEIPEYGVPLCGSIDGTGKGIERDADIVDNSHLTVNSIAEYQNSGQDACLSLEMRASEKGHGCGNDRTQPEYTAWERLQNPYSVCGRPEAGGQEPVFADKTVEAMVMELLGKQKTGFQGSGMECGQEPGAAAGQPYWETQMQDGESRDSVIVETEMPKQRDSKRNDTEYSKTENNKTDFSAVCVSYPSYQSSPARQYAQGGQQYGRHSDCRMDGTGEEIGAYRECIRENIDYQCFRP